MKTQSRLALVRLFFIGTAAVFVVSCGKKTVKQPPPVPTQVQESAVAEMDTEVSEREGSLRDRQYVADPALITVTFDFDKTELSEASRKTLRENAASLKKRPAVEVQVSGHCDEKGTTEYNLALGQRRANAVRNYYKYLGVKMSRMSTISYGEERPVCQESSEECWSRNRRAETLVKVK